ncbi:unnamed protein product [Rotaria sp. Silwood2]|nr:unnamed protein product [Rotaria sp. Silwood2]CAF2916993.1 unnamed protein product [Rotaria sp. Silwood2]CAF3209968.1 unnamed protein product [Rotaria sp. Silwood2]CAF4157444.1 unnamed protein product [Rotaria sp. Silwood2]CAF4229911.1 unnamed protein product [Rotaria sp. Silwood2]
MNQSNTSKISTFTSIIPNEQSSATIHGKGYINMGPLTTQHYEIPSKCIHEIKQEVTSSAEPSLSNNQYQFKVMLLGDSGVGKTCLLIRFDNETFLNSNFHSTVGIDYRHKVVTLGNRKINLQIFDTAGQERFRSVTPAYYRDAHALLLIYDVTSYSSFENISVWLNEIKEYTHNDTIIMLIGNKVDKYQRVVSREAGERLAQNYQIYFLETSAKTGQNVELAFMTTAQAILDKKLHTNNTNHLLNDRIKLKNTEANNSCC